MKLETQLNSLSLFLSPSQVHLLSELVTALTESGESAANLATLD